MKQKRAARGGGYTPNAVQRQGGASARIGAVNIAMLILGIGCVLVGSYSLIGRNVIVSRLRARPDAGRVQPPIAYAVVGIILGLAGIFWILTVVS